MFLQIEKYCKKRFDMIIYNYLKIYIIQMKNETYCKDFIWNIKK